MGKYSVKVGSELEVEAFDIEQMPSPELIAQVASASSNMRHQRTRGALAMVIAMAIVGALLGAALLGYLDGSYDEVGSIWDASALPFGYVLATYFVKG